MPVIVKETGMGIDPGTVAELFALGARYVNIAGSGGTNWVRVESYRDDAAAASAPLFDSWGIPTALALAALGRTRRGVLASGGIRNGLEVGQGDRAGRRSGGLGAAVCTRGQTGRCGRRCGAGSAHMRTSCGWRWP